VTPLCSYGLSPSPILVILSLGTQLHPSQFVAFCAQLLAWLRLDEQSLLPPLELWMFLPLSCTLLLCWLLLPRVVVVLPTALHLLVLLFLFPHCFLNDFLCGIPYLVVDSVHVIIGQIIDWGFLVCFGLLACTSYWLLPLIFAFHSLWGLSIVPLLLMAQAYLLHHCSGHSPTPHPVLHHSYPVLLHLLGAPFFCWGFPPIFPIIHDQAYILYCQPIVGWKPLGAGSFFACTYIWCMPSLNHAISL
jgi:hypothetical protein